MSDHKTRKTAAELKAEQDAKKTAAAKAHHDELTKAQERQRKHDEEQASAFVASIAEVWHRLTVAAAEAHADAEFVVLAEVVGVETIDLLKDIVADAKDSGFSMELAAVQPAALPHGRPMPPHQVQELQKAVAEKHAVRDSRGKLGAHPGHKHVRKHGRSGEPRSLVVRWR